MEIGKFFIDIVIFQRVLGGLFRFAKFGCDRKMAVVRHQGVEKLNNLSVAYLLSNICTKNYWNRTTTVTKYYCWYLGGILF